MIKRELIDTGTHKRYVRREGKSQFKESDDLGRSLRFLRTGKCRVGMPPRREA